MDRLNLSSLLLVEVGQNFDPVLHRVLHVFLPVQMISQGVGSKNAEDRYEAVSCNLQSCLEEMFSGEPGRAILGGMSRHRECVFVGGAMCWIDRKVVDSGYKYYEYMTSG
ncbi:uncharacterized protein TRAVEDRAFT_27462 [Trametes versicolor FP-101664 SS1]|uniref:uncharacterized protein n=1 Tax=Trametes versicolor (strain FP-101664) TaxID=717944 RepID=UPI0004623119|nr:uncharacterized protein TRAVEDRAFT_27462 [Trametes versicolor FP-101664 SS1]EIW62078.1 hypothetical protein TRAVEDRAFT_27462 [Trametes versicolor FP-101664 SS1]